MSRSVRRLLVLGTLQVLLAGVYWLVEHRRSRSAENDRSEAMLGTAPPRRIDAPMPAIVVEQRDGRRARIAPSSRPTLIHIWATWCPPCRAELPELLALANRQHVEVTAIALDDRWPEVDGVLGEVNSEDVVLSATAGLERTLGVADLPVTFLIVNDRLVLRFDGARDWSNGEFVRNALGSCLSSPGSD